MVQLQWYPIDKGSWNQGLASDNVSRTYMYLPEGVASQMTNSNPELCLCPKQTHSI